MIVFFPIRSGLLAPTLSIISGVFLLLPGGIDGATQMFGGRESTNRIRVVTGILLGIGVVLFSEGVFMISVRIIM